MVYKKAEETDIPQLVRMRIAYLMDDYGTVEDRVLEEIQASLPEYFIKHLNQDMCVFLAWDGELLIATAMLLVIEKPANPSFMTGKIGIVMNVYTAPEYRRKGIARMLIQMLVKEAEEKQLDFIELKATKDGYHLYRQLGFQEVKSRNTEMKLLLREMVIT